MRAVVLEDEQPFPVMGDDIASQPRHVGECVVDQLCEFREDGDTHALEGVASLLGHGRKIVAIVLDVILPAPTIKAFVV